MSRTPRWAAIVFLASASTGACAVDPAREITAEGIRRDVAALSADSMEGRGAGTRGEDRAAAYLAARFEAIGLRPLGTTYYLPVQLVGMKKDAGRSSLTIRGPAGTLPHTDNETITFDLVDVPIVFVGYGVEAPEYEWDDFKDSDVRGKVLLFLNDDPPVVEADGPLFGGPTRTYYGRWTYKFEQAMRHGAAGAIVIHTTGSASYPFSVIGNTGSREIWARDYKLEFLAWIDSTSSERIAASMGTDLAGLFAVALERDFRPRDTGYRLTAHVETAIRRVETKNVAAVLDGVDRERRDEHLVFTAHYDHLGVTKTPSGSDSVYNGAWGNAAGTAAILSLAQAFVAARPRRSVAFVAVAAEEGGLLGSGGFVSAPPIPLPQFVANYNVDMPQIFGVTEEIAAIGMETNTLGAILQDVARDQGLRVIGDPNPGAGSFYRSDQVNFAKAGVPALYIQPGKDYVEPLGVDPVAYREAHYHQVTDELREEWNLEGTARDMRVLFAAALRVANDDELPRWVPGSEFETEWKALYGRE